LTEDGCIPDFAGQLNEYKPGKARITFNLPRNAFIMEEMHFIARMKTKLGNPYITQVKHYLAIENK
ncbi:MAG: hypothetical protein R3345_14120, partial [Fulvivirga sp.]|nr:hypothetical protein [Fulvivirga sp.]